MHGQDGDQPPQNKITGDGADHNQKMSHLSPPDIYEKSLIQQRRHPQTDLREHVKQKYREHLDHHERQHPDEDLVERHVRRRHPLEVEGGHRDRRREERRLEVQGHEQTEEERIYVEVRQERDEDRHEDDDDLGPLQRPAQKEDDHLRQEHELHRRHVERLYPIVDDLLAAKEGE